LRAELGSTFIGRRTKPKESAHWQRDPELSGQRGEVVLATLAEAEREAWRKLGTEVENTLNKVRRITSPEEKSQKKP